MKREISKVEKVEVENVKVASQLAQTDILVSFSRRFGCFYLLVGINITTHVKATLLPEISDFSQLLKDTGLAQLLIKI